ncbi:leucine-rich repeat transmembrane neuronal protein 3 isoform X2 [Aedes aegypti]|uniref:Uncharacterized protein n=3 Tax=Aedes aegypti TaxID=7159 RepID=A0A6I8TIU5_AEDAE|nr:leucine-rich repeat transmembrane neuronal protein 3 isoform X2 [Aedes aegypti]
MRPTMASWVIPLLLAGVIAVSIAETYDCTIEKDNDLEICVFRNVKYFKNTTQIAFYSPGSTKPENVAFKDSHMVAIPPNFLIAFADNLKVLKVENCQLQTVTITKNLLALHAKNNYIEKVLMYRNNQCENLRELDLSSNRLGNVANVTSCLKLETLNLSENEDLWEDSTLDLSVFSNMVQLQDLNLAGTGVLYLDNTKKIGLPLLKTIDLSKNDILPSDLRLEIFYPFTALETLKLNDNNMDSIDYAHLLDMKSLKAVYLNGNSFQCRNIKDMLDFLQEHNIATPTDRHSNCEQNEREVEGMCCTGPMPPRPRPEPVPSPQTTPSPPPPQPPPEEPGKTDHEDGHKAQDNTNGSNEGGNGSSHLVIIGAAVIVIVAAIGGGIYWYKRRSA